MGHSCLVRSQRSYTEVNTFMSTSAIVEITVSLIPCAFLVMRNLTVPENALVNRSVQYVSPADLDLFQ